MCRSRARRPPCSRCWRTDPDVPYRGAGGRAAHCGGHHACARGRDSQTLAVPSRRADLGEAGIPGHEVGFWMGVLAPAGTPKGRWTCCNAHIGQILKPPDIKERLDTSGSTPSQHVRDALRSHEGRNRQVDQSGTRGQYQDRMTHGAPPEPAGRRAFASRPKARHEGGAGPDRRRRARRHDAGVRAGAARRRLHAGGAQPEHHAPSQDGHHQCAQHGAVPSSSGWRMRFAEWRCRKTATSMSSWITTLSDTSSTVFAIRALPSGGASSASATTARMPGEPPMRVSQVEIEPVLQRAVLAAPGSTRAGASLSRICRRMRVE